MLNLEESSLSKLMQKLQNKIPLGEGIRYSVPDLWNCFDYKGEEKIVDNNGLTFVNPYKFYFSCIKDFIIPQKDEQKNYNKSFSKIMDELNEEKDYLSGDWIKKSSVYVMHVRTSTSWDHNGSGILEEINEYGLNETGTFVKTIVLLPLLKKMGIDTIFLLPVSKYSNKYTKGEFGSPYAVKNFFTIDSGLKDNMTGLDFSVEEEFRALVEACHILGIRIMVDIIVRTSARDSEMILEHPDWFYWIKKADEADYFPPLVDGIAPSERPSLDNIEKIYQSAKVWEHIKKFTPSPDIINGEKWKEIREICKNNLSIDFLELIEKEFMITIAPAFSGFINDPEPTLRDITFLKLFLDDPIHSQSFTEGHNLAPYILFDTINGELFQGQLTNKGLWDELEKIIPYYQENFGIDGAKIEMGNLLPIDLVEMIIERTRLVDNDFAFIAEELFVNGAEKARENGYNMIIGYGWWLEPRVLDYKTHEFMYGSHKIQAPIFACSETPDTPRIAAREGGRTLAKFLTSFNQFLPNSVPLISTGQEVYETQPLNTWLDSKEEDRFRLSSEDQYNGKLALFDRFQLHWLNENRWDIPDNLAVLSKIRKEYIETFSNPNNFVPIHFESPFTNAIGLAYIIEGRRWKTNDNVIIIVGNTDMYNGHEYTLFLENVRYESGNSSKKAWLMYSPHEWSHDIYDFDHQWDLQLSFRPGEVKVLIM